MKKVKQLNNIFKITFVFVGTILGAGFASGKEIVTFFAKFSNLGIFGFFLSCFLFFLSCFSILYIIYKFKFENYNEFMKHLFGEKLGKAISYFNAFFLFTIFFVMIAGGGSTLKVFFPQINSKVLNVIFCIIIFICLNFGTKGIVKVNELISPILVFGIILCSIYLNFFKTVPVFKFTEVTYSAIIYSSYNIITIISLLFSMRELILNKKSCFYSAVLSSVIIFFIGFFMLLPLIKHYNFIYNIDLPIVYLIEKNSLTLEYIYTILLFLAIFTTAIGNGFAFIDFMNEKTKQNSIFLKFNICILALIFSFIGFSNLVEKIYPLFGYLGVFQLVIILLSFFSSFKSNNTKDF